MTGKWVRSASQRRRGWACNSQSPLSFASPANRYTMPTCARNAQTTHAATWVHDATLSARSCFLPSNTVVGSAGEAVACFVCSSVSFCLSRHKMETPPQEEVARFVGFLVSFCLCCLIQSDRETPVLDVPPYRPDMASSDQW